ncbi:hypothetical protein [Nocardiopsis quinghaiensis]|uniref:hypothetical protein n=1 Tax=Nocardiopsis quinghaiensis TaxID=464995 RepID=UPI00123B0472|nr:hypothetical protein [Nocardiopsis quinghaiensis]
MTTTTNPVRALRIAGDRIRARTVNGAGNHRVDAPSIVVNTGTTPVFVAREPRRAIPPLSSTILSGVTLDHADSLVLLEVEDGEPVSDITGEPGWSLLGDLLTDPHVTGGLPFPRETPLWRGPRERIGTLRLDAGLLLGQQAGGVETFDVWVNLWFAPAGTDCFIHRLHDFIEVHTQVRGIGRMQKFTEQDHATLYEDLAMAPGHTTPNPFCARTDEGGLVYPWHQYHAETDCVWMAVEYHRLP